jgi:O-antigen/teichoic acid export membrane protein
VKRAAHRVAINTGILYVRIAITVFVSLYTTRVILGALGTEDFGIFNLVGGTIVMLTFLNASMAAATQRFMSYAQGQGDELRQRSIFNVSVVLHAIIAIVIVAILEGAGYILFNGVLKIAPDRMQAAWMVYQFAVASMFFTILSVPYDAVINAREHMLLFAVLGVIEAFLKLGIALFIVKVDSDKLVVYGLLMALLSVALLLLRMMYCHICYHECKIAPVRYINRPLFKEMTSFAGWSFFGTSTSMIANYGQGVVLNMFFGAKVNAAQAVAGQVSGAARRVRCYYVACT